MDTKAINHWGTWVSSDTPVTGVISNHSAEWLHEESWDGIDLAMEQHFKECEICANGDYTRRGALCSPCYPGQVDLDTPGDYLGYDLPPDIYGDTT